jgi:hypothetical protein
MPRRTGHSVERRDEDHIKLVLPGVLHQGVKPRSPRFRTGHAHINMLGYDFITALLCELAEIAQLGFNVLFWR